MYLKAACSEIPVPRQRGGPRLERCPSSIQQRLGTGIRVYPSSPTSCLPGGFEPSRPRGQQSLEELLHVHSHLFQASVQHSSSMVYRSNLQHGGGGDTVDCGVRQGVMLNDYLERRDGRGGFESKGPFIKQSILAAKPRTIKAVLPCLRTLETGQGCLPGLRTAAEDTADASVGMRIFAGPLLAV
ncbi:hypothetical protein D9C73_013857 [Collichthys lucidus]|uniref:Uncharacterized protein n=1 Tax=Collichthys lucidus TaxID=240159 RepID=A0A4V6AT38_COLLU|nr:hypothetical protein D9C73_013857 [Collichthys lucidus]